MKIVSPSSFRFSPRLASFLIRLRRLFPSTLIGTCASSTVPISLGSASSPDGLDPQDGNAQWAANAVLDGDLDTYWDQQDDATGPHVLQLDGSYSFGGYSFITYEPNNFAPKSWTLTCDGVEIDAQENYVYQSTTTFTTCTGLPHTCSIVQLRITAWHGPSPAIREFSLHPIDQEGKNLKLAADPKWTSLSQKNARNVTHAVRHEGRSGDVPCTRVCVTRTRGRVTRTIRPSNRGGARPCPAPQPVAPGIDPARSIF